jgi:hypothetical protein
MNNPGSAVQLRFGNEKALQAAEKLRAIPVEFTSWWKPPHLCGGRSASALREKLGFDHAL